MTWGEYWLPKIHQQFEKILFWEFITVLPVQCREPSAFIQSPWGIFKHRPVEKNKKFKYCDWHNTQREEQNISRQFWLTVLPMRKASCTGPVCCRPSWHSSKPSEQPVKQNTHIVPHNLSRTILLTLNWAESTFLAVLQGFWMVSLYIFRQDIEGVIVGCGRIVCKFMDLSTDNLSLSL